MLKEESIAICRTTYKDNPYLTQAQIAEIESYRDKDPEVWRIYGLGLRRERVGIIYRNWQIGDYNWDTLDYPVLYGLDFGYTAPSAVVGVKFCDDVLYVKEFLYRSYLSTADLIMLVRQVVGRELVICDSSEPRTIQELQRAGVNAVPVKKQANIMDSIRLVQKYRIVITRDSRNLIREIENYAFSVDPNGQILEVPVRVNDHALDAMRYAVMMYSQYNYAIY
jgi:phage terminase large subunit